MKHLLHKKSVSVRPVSIKISEAYRDLGHSKILTTGGRLLNSAVCSGRGIGICGASILIASKVVNHLGIELFDGLRLRTV
jgi:hypothetical protein